jgi:HSP20 family protein
VWSTPVTTGQKEVTMISTWGFPMLDRLIDDVMNDVSGTAFGRNGTQNIHAPAIDVRANDEEIVFVCDVPGLKQEDLEVTLEADVLTIKGQRRYAGSEKDRVWLGRSHGAFARSFTLPDGVDPEKMSADLADGVLTLRVPKHPRAKPRRIAIASGAKQLEAKNPKGRMTHPG